MKFSEFKKAIEEKRPDITIYQNGMAYSIDVLFNDSKKLYTYRGSYCEVMNKLGIKAITKSAFCKYEEMLRDAQENRRGFGLFSDMVDNSKKIRELQALIEKIKLEYVIV